MNNIEAKTLTTANTEACGCDDCNCAGGCNCGDCQCDPCTCADGCGCEG